MRPLSVALLSALLLPALGLACGGGGGASSGGNGGGGGIPGTTCPTGTVIASPTFTAHILPAIQSSCGADLGGCHGGTGPSGHITYSTTNGRTAADVLNDLLTRPPSAPAGYSFVKPGDVSKSWIIEKVTSDNPGGGFGGRMPAGKPNLCTPTVDTWKNWINAGAPL